VPAAAKGGDMDKTEHSDLGAPRTGNTPRPESRWVPPPCDMTILCDHRSTPSRAEILGAQAYETITNTANRLSMIKNAWPRSAHGLGGRYSWRERS